LKSSYV